MVFEVLPKLGCEEGIERKWLGVYKNENFAIVCKKLL